MPYSLLPKKLQITILLLELILLAGLKRDVVSSVSAQFLSVMLQILRSDSSYGTYITSLIKAAFLVMSHITMISSITKKKVQSLVEATCSQIR